jgi:hypothetical protein
MRQSDRAGQAIYGYAKKFGKREINARDADPYQPD